MVGIVLVGVAFGLFFVCLALYQFYAFERAGLRYHGTIVIPNRTPISPRSAAQRVPGSAFANGML
jgi:hypothetical protein